MHLTAFGAAISLSILLLPHEASARVAPHPRVDGAALAQVTVTGPSYPKGKLIDWSTLSTTVVKEGLYTLRAWVPAGGLIDAAEIPACAVRKRILLDGKQVASPERAPAIVQLGGRGGHDLAVEVNVSSYENRIACGDSIRVGATVGSREGWTSFRYASDDRKAGGGQAAIFVPRGHDLTKPSVALVGLHPWNGDMWTYAAYEELASEANARNVVLILPPGLGNSLYVAKAEREVMKALEAATDEVALDQAAIGLWGASMGGAGATTIGFHHPDLFSMVVSYFGDSKYSMSSYVSNILKDDDGAKAVNALDVVENARNLPVWLIHGTTDKVSSIKQSEILAAALKQQGFDFVFDKEPNRGHEGSLVAQYLRRVVERAAKSRVPTVKRVTYRSFRNDDTSAYGVHFQRAKGATEVFVDVVRNGDSVVIKRADGVAKVSFDPDAFGAKTKLKVVRESGVKAEATW